MKVILFDNVHVVYQLRGAPQLSIDTFHASLLSHTTEYIFIENDKFQVCAIPRLW